jgi:hypothetical protein
MNQLQAIAMNEGVRRKRGLWTQQGRSQLESLPCLPSWPAKANPTCSCAASRSGTRGSSGR